MPWPAAPSNLLRGTKNRAAGAGLPARARAANRIVVMHIFLAGRGVTRPHIATRGIGPYRSLLSRKHA